MCLVGLHVSSTCIMSLSGEIFVPEVRSLQGICLRFVFGCLWSSSLELFTSLINHARELIFQGAAVLEVQSAGFRDGGFASASQVCWLT